MFKAVCHIYSNFTNQYLELRLKENTIKTPSNREGLTHVDMLNSIIHYICNVIKIRFTVIKSNSPDDQIRKFMCYSL